PPFGARAIAVDLDAVFLRVVQVERLAHEMVRRAAQPPARPHDPGQRGGELGPARDEDREVEQPARPGGSGRRGGAGVELHHRGLGGAEVRRLAGRVERAQADRALVELALTVEVGDPQPDPARLHRGPYGAVGRRPRSVKPTTISSVPRTSRPSPTRSASVVRPMSGFARMITPATIERVPSKPIHPRFCVLSMARTRSPIPTRMNQNEKATSRASRLAPGRTRQTSPATTPTNPTRTLTTPRATEIPGAKPAARVKSPQIRRYAPRMIPSARRVMSG